MSELYRRPVWAEIDLAAITKNVERFRKLIGPRPLLMAVVKANGYGHGAKEVAETALKSGANRLGVALLEEGVGLREAGIQAPIQILGEIPPSGAGAAIENDLIATVCSFGVAGALSKAGSRAGKDAKVHIKVDTGMNRLGLFPGEVVKFLKQISSLSDLVTEGIFTHFALADNPQSDHTLRQFRKFQDLTSAPDFVSVLPEGGASLIKHVANSAATIFFPDTHLDMVRIGISLYGLHPSPATRDRIALFPALQLKAKISSVKAIKAGQGVSYGLTYKATRPTKIALLPLGYGDGFTRLLSNRCQALIRGRRFPIAGTICMDQLMVDVGDNPISPGDEAVLIGKQGTEQISADELAGVLGTINYEVVCMINRRVPRVYKS